MSAMASKAKKWATIISFTASRIFFFLIFFQIPLFRFPCRIGSCSTPMELTSSHLIASEVMPSWVVKAFLYPGAIGKSILNNEPIPKYNKLLDAYKLNNLRRFPSTIDLRYLEVVAGSYLVVAGAMVGLLRSRRLGFFGMLLLWWGVCKEPHLSLEKGISVYYLTMLIAVVSAFLSIRDDVEKIVSCFSKSKYK